MSSWLVENWQYWHWWVLGCSVALLDLILGANFAFVWTGVALLITGVFALFFPSTAGVWQWCFFAIFELVCLWIWRYVIVKRAQSHSDRPDLNKRLQSHVGQIYELTRDVVDGKSAIKIHDSDWLVSCAEPLTAGSRVKVQRVDGVTLIVVPKH